MNTDALLPLLAGLGLAAACGFRIFVPFLVLSLAARADYLTVPASVEWITSDLALTTLLVATVLEIGAFYIPWVDNALDALASPVAVVAGAFAMMATGGLEGMDPFLQWVVAVIGGGGTAAVTQATSVMLRGTSLVGTGGLGNPVVATTENAGSAVASITALAAPLLILPLLLFFGGLFFWLLIRIKRKKRAGGVKEEF